jgi:hypothetical protein
MRNYWLRAAGLATIAFTMLSAPTLSIAQTVQQKPIAHAAKNNARKHTSDRWQHQAVRNGRLNVYGSTRGVYGSARDGCTWPYQNQFPPCMSTFPEGSPHYHGPRPGPTFSDE